MSDKYKEVYVLIQGLFNIFERESSQKNRQTMTMFWEFPQEDDSLVIFR